MPEESEQPKTGFSDLKTIVFIITLSFICALILALLASSLSGPQQVAKELDRSKQMLMAARILSPGGYFQVEKEGKYVPAEWKEGGVLEPSEKIVYPDQKALIEVYTKRLKPFLVSREGKITTFKEAGIDENEYISNNRKKGYYLLPEMLIYEILPNVGEGKDEEKETKPIGYVIPINGYGLWDAIFGYLAVKPDGDTVIGIAWYEQKETPGLGAVITEPQWQAQFFGKKVFEESPDGKTDFKTAPLGITVVKGAVANVYGTKPKAKSAVDGIPGSTLTGNGVTKAYSDVLAPYRPFLIGLQKEEESKHDDK